MVEFGGQHRRKAALVVAGAFLLASVVLLAHRAHASGVLTALLSFGAFGLLGNESGERTRDEIDSADESR